MKCQSTPLRFQMPTEEERQQQFEENKADPRKEPFAATMEEWKDIRERQQTEYPMWYFFHKTVPSWYRHKCRQLKDFRNWFRYRLLPSRRYHVVKTGLPPGWYDTDTRIFHVCFQLFQFFMEKDGGIRRMDGGCDPENGPEWEKVYSEIAILWDWWKYKRPARNVDWYSDSLTDEEVSLGFAQDDAWEKEDQEMLKRLIEIRGGLWT